MEFNIKYFLLVLYLNVYLIPLNLAEELKFHYDKIERQNGTEQYFDYKLNVVKADGQENVFMVDSTTEVKQDIDNAYELSIEVFREENNEYQSLFSFPKLGVCDLMKTLYKIYIYDDISKYSNLPNPETCPFPKGEYEIKQYPFDMKKYAQYISLARPGSYRLTVFLVKEDVAVCGALIYGHVTEAS